MVMRIIKEPLKIQEGLILSVKIMRMNINILQLTIQKYALKLVWILIMENINMKKIIYVIKLFLVILIIIIIIKVYLE